MKLIFFGSGAFGLPTLEALLSGHTGGLAAAHEVVMVVTQPDRLAGRGKKSTPTPVRAFCDARGVPVMPVERVNDPEVVQRLLGQGARLGVVVAFAQRIGRAVLDGLPCGCVNLHASLLPKYRGASPINRVILEGETTTGVTVFRLVERMDAGLILTRAETKIGEMETAGELHDRLAEMGPKVVFEALEKFEQDPDPPGEVQDDARVTWAPRLKKEDGVIDWNRPASAVVRLIHGMCPWPGASTTFTSGRTDKSEPVTILRAQVIDADVSTNEPGRLGTAHHNKVELCVFCGSGALLIREIKPANSRAMTWQDFVNGRHVTTEDRFEQARTG